MRLTNRFCPLLFIDMLVPFCVLGILLLRGIQADELEASDGFETTEKAVISSATEKAVISSSTEAHSLFATEKPIVGGTTQPGGCAELCKDMYESCARRKAYCNILVRISKIRRFIHLFFKCTTK